MSGKWQVLEHRWRWRGGWRNPQSTSEAEAVAQDAMYLPPPRVNQWQSMCGGAKSRMCRLPVCVQCVFLITVITEVAATPDSTNTWMRPQPPQTLHGLMISIDERLQALETSRWETTLKQTEQRLDSMESTLRRLDSTFQDRLDKLERNLNSKELKDELTVEKLSHKLRDILDSSYDRYNRRLGYTEERLELSFKKVQMSIEGSLNRIEKQQEDVQTEVLEAVTILEDLKAHSSTAEDKLNSTHRSIQQHIQNLMSPNHDELQRISGSLEHLGSRLNNSLGMWGSQNDGTGPHANDVVTTIRKEINSEGIKFTSKINNMYNDLWRRVSSVEGVVKELSRLANATQRELLEEMRSMGNNERRDFPGDSQENFLEVAVDALERKLQRKLVELGRKLDTLSATQNLVMDSCFDGTNCRSLESRLSQVLEKIFDVFSAKFEGFSNRTFDLDSLVMEMMELVKAQHSHLIRTVTHNTNMVVTLAKDSSDASKLLHNTVTQLAEKSDYNFQELHDDMQEISNGSGKICSDGEKNNEETTDQQKPTLKPPKNITEIKVFTINITEPTKNATEKHHDAGVLKITTDDFGTLADNSTLANVGLNEVKLNSSGVLDTSILQVMGMISSNLTQNQFNTLLQYLNRSISFENLEAIIQNTEAEPDDEGITNAGSSEVYDNEPVNKTNNEDEPNVLRRNDTKLLSLSQNSGEAEIFEEETDTSLNEMSDSVTNTNGTKIMQATDKNTSKTELNPLVPIEIKDQLKVYALLLKIKHGNLNISALWKQFDTSLNQTEELTPPKLPSVLQKLCYGEEHTEDFTTEYIGDTMRNRLLLINRTINDANLYEKIENICNTITESLQSQKISEEVSLED